MNKLPPLFTLIFPFTCSFSVGEVVPMPTLPSDLIRIRSRLFENSFKSEFTETNCVPFVASEKRYPYLVPATLRFNNALADEPFSSNTCLPVAGLFTLVLPIPTSPDGNKKIPFVVLNPVASIEAGSPTVQ